MNNINKRVDHQVGVFGPQRITITIKFSAINMNSDASAVAIGRTAESENDELFYGDLAYKAEIQFIVPSSLKYSSTPPQGDDIALPFPIKRIITFVPSINTTGYNRISTIKDWNSSKPPQSFNSGTCWNERGGGGRGRVYVFNEDEKAVEIVFKRNDGLTFGWLKVADE